MKETVNDVKDMKRTKTRGKTEIIESGDLISQDDLQNQKTEILPDSIPVTKPKKASGSNYDIHSGKDDTDLSEPASLPVKEPALQSEKTTVENEKPEVTEHLSSGLESLKKKKIANIPEPVVETKEKARPEKEKKIKEKREAPKPNYVRYYDTPIIMGLSDEIVEKRKAEKLINSVGEEKGKTVLGIILRNIFTFFNMLYLVITILFVVLGSYENLLFLLTIIPNLIIGIIQEINAKKMIDKLSLMSFPTATVIRNGDKIEIPIQEVVLDDIIYYSSGKQICADSIVIEGNIEVNESLLTGESDVIMKNPGDSLMSGSFVVSGVAVARVDKVGKDNYIEKLSKDAKIYKKPQSELLRTLNGIVKAVSVIIIPLAIATYLSSAGDVRDFMGFLNREALIKASSSILAMIPAGLFLLTSTALAVSVIRLGRSKTLVQELYCIEMLARTNVLCLDKTGTITDGTMRVIDCIEIKNHTEYTIREIIGSMMSTFEDVNPTSEALIKYFDKNSILTATDKVPFSSKRKYSAVTFGKSGTFILGAPEFVLSENYDKVAPKVERFAKEGCRVLVLGHTLLKPETDELPKTVRPICLIVLQDHIREDAADTIDYFKENGVDIKVISGDNPATVSEIAQRAGVEGAEHYISLAGLTDDEVRESVFEYTVFGRVSPNQKKIIVQTLREHKKTVAMTGDGVNDILALKEADCSIAMASGSEATRYVSHLVLMDSNFSSMPKVVAEGRRVINNIQKTSTLFLVKTIFSIILAVIYIFLGMSDGPLKMSYPFSAKNLYMIEWFACGIPAFFLALQQNRDIVKGRFLPNVLKSTLPGALTVVILHLLLNVLRIVPGFENFRNNYNVFTTVATVVTTAVMMIVLFKVSHPFNWMRKTVYIVMVFLCFIAGFNLIPFMRMNLSYRKSVDEYNVHLEVRDGRWFLNGYDTNVMAIKEGLENIEDGTYLSPVITVSEDYKWCLNGIITDVSVYYKAGGSDAKLPLHVKDGYWYIGEIATRARAYNLPQVTFEFDEENYEKPVLTVNKNGYWCLDAVSTNVSAGEVIDNLVFTINYEGYWRLNGKTTPVLAEKKKIILNENEYITPTVTIDTTENQRYFKINGILTDILANDGDLISLNVGIDSYWYINGNKTTVRAIKISDTIVEEIDYVKPVLEINNIGTFNINDTNSHVVAEDSLLVTEIMISIAFVQLAYPCMYLISILLKKIRLTPGN